MADDTYTTAHLHTEIQKAVVEGLLTNLKADLSWEVVDKIILAVRKGYEEEARKPDRFHIDTFVDGPDGYALKGKDGEYLQGEEARVEFSMLPWFMEADGEFEISSAKVPLSEILLEQGGMMAPDSYCEGSIEDAIAAVERSVAKAKARLTELKEAGKLRLSGSSRPATP